MSESKADGMKSVITSGRGFLRGLIPRMQVSEVSDTGMIDEGKEEQRIVEMPRMNFSKHGAGNVNTKKTG